MHEYGTVAGSRTEPVVVQSSGIAIVGARHTRDPRDPQLGIIQAAWESLHPTVALVEGRLGFLIPYLMNPVEEFGESGFVAELAKSNGADLYSWELPKSELITRLLESHPPERVALLQVLSAYFSNYRFGRPADPNQFVQGYLHRASYPGLDNVIVSIDDIDRIWKRDFTGQPDWRETSDEYGLPGYLAQIADDANMIRNQHLLCEIKELLKKDERVFVICGSSHAICLEPAITSQQAALEY